MKEKFTMKKLSYYIIGIIKEIMGDRSLRTDMAIIFHLFNSLIYRRYYFIC